MRLSPKKIAIVAVAGLAVAIIPATPALAMPVCGATLLVNTTLTSDLVCAGNALKIGAAGIILDLGGFKIVGNGTGIGVDDNSFGNVTIRNGTITNFATGMNFFGSNVATLNRLTVLGGTGLSAQIFNDISVSASEFRATSVKFSMNSKRAAFSKVLFRGTPVSLSEANDSQFTTNDWLDSSLNSFESDNARVMDNAFVRSFVDYHTTSRNWQVQNNVFRGTNVALTIGATSFGGQIISNQFINNNLGVFTNVGNLAEINGTAISGNTFVNNGAAGVLFNSAAITGAPTIRITSNQFIHNGFTPAGRVDRLGRPVLDGLHTATTAGSQIFVGGNVTTVNARYGIFADPGTVVDSGGNETIADPSGCLGVVCA
jgi:hypothetical protein